MHACIYKVHIVYMGDRPKDSALVASTHHSMLAHATGSKRLARESLIYSYGKSFNGFVAKLSDTEVARISDMEGVISVFPNTRLQIHTTRSWNFMGFDQPHSVFGTESDVIIGLLDTGVWPENPSFADDDIGPPPAKWKGICQGANNFTCNNKVIGARFYDIENISLPGWDINSPRDAEGHGSHTASTAAGREVQDVSYFGLAKGVARGGVPKARIAVYKVCWLQGCTVADILAGFEDAIADGVDIISVSLGSDWPSPYHKDPIAIGTFHAMRNGILTSCSAGNSGPYRGQVSNYAPWALTVAASTIDRSFVTQVVLGNGKTFLGTSLNSFNLTKTTFPLVYSADAANYTLGIDDEIARICFPGTLTPLKTKGAIILCDVLYDGSVAIDGEAVGVIMPSSFEDLAFAFPVPVAVISYEDHDLVLDYIKSAENPTATILTTETWTDIMAPSVVFFSSRGPSPISPNILKPDITAPGVNILAAWSPLGGASVSPSDSRKVDYFVISGTSMSCPHVSGAAAYVKSAHPTWSPAAVKSALMTTAKVMDSRKNEDAEFAYGAGHIDPLKAIDPGLVYDASEADYVDFLCKEGYNTTLVRIISGDNSSCPSDQPGKAWDLNYPSFSLSLLDGETVMATYPRTVTNVGPANSIYHAKVSMPSPFTVEVEPTTLSFSEVGEKKSFTLKIYGSPIVNTPIVSGSLEWTDGHHVVRSPIVVFNNIPSIWASLDDQSAMSHKKYTGSWDGTTPYHKNGIFRAMKKRA
ncbi:cucumisin-like [Carica papaya]|uniref:cucumisin-like n=1 Tax=Carica papaya TaxID=3649 RepID=UPI000B8CA7EE|nr:cucumisin-like [Carica papaya]